LATRRHSILLCFTSLKHSNGCTAGNITHPVETTRTKREAGHRTGNVFITWTSTTVIYTETLSHSFTDCGWNGNKAMSFIQKAERVLLRLCVIKTSGTTTDGFGFNTETGRFLISRTTFWKFAETVVIRTKTSSEERQGLKKLRKPKKFKGEWETYWQIIASKMFEFPP
jgi:hypothetical protein